MSDQSKKSGRPARAGDRSTQRIEFVVTPQERAALTVVAKENRLPVATLVRDAVNEYVADYREKPVFIRRGR